MPFNATMVREKCVIQDAALGKQGSKVLSNRLVLPLNKDETLVVRGHNMHSVARMGARLYNKAQDGQSLTSQKDTIDWAKLWDEIHNGAHLANSPNNWISAFVGGKLLFSSGDHHPFLDVIEQQVAANGGSYDVNVVMAAETFKAAGHPLMEIDHSTNVALILSVEEETGRCGLIYRHPRRTTTFSFTATPNARKAGGGRPIMQEVAGMLEMSADFLESIQVCYAIAAESSKGADQDFGKEMDMRTRLSDMRKSIDGFENGVTMSYRPERPDFNRFLQEAQILLTKRARG